MFLIFIIVQYNILNIYHIYCRFHISNSCQLDLIIFIPKKKKSSLEKSLLRSKSSLRSNLEKVTDFLSLFRPTFPPPHPQPNRKIIRNSKLGGLLFRATSSNVCRIYKRKKFRFAIQLYIPRMLLEQTRPSNANSNNKRGEEDGRQRSSTRNPIQRSFEMNRCFSINPPFTLPFSLIPSSISQHTRARSYNVHPRPSSSSINSR